MKRKLIFISLVIVLCASIVFVGCQQAPAAPGDKGPIKIGHLRPLTGSMAIAGQYMVKGVELALDEIGNEVAGRKIEVIVEDLQTIKPAYAEIFMPVITDLDEGSARIAKLDEFGEIRSEMRTIKDTILVKAQESLENLRYRLGVKIRLAAAKLMGAGVEIPKEAQEGISELNSIGVAADTVFSLPAIARKMVELYEKKISAEVIESLNQAVKVISPD